VIGRTQQSLHALKLSWIQSPGKLPPKKCGPRFKQLYRAYQSRSSL